MSGLEHQCHKWQIDWAIDHFPKVVSWACIVSIAGLFLVSKQQSKAANKKLAGNKFCLITCWTPIFHFHRGVGCGEWESVSEQTERSEKWNREAGRQREGARNGVRYRDLRETAREKFRENVIWSGCFRLHAPFALPYREGEWRVSTGIESVD